MKKPKTQNALGGTILSMRGALIDQKYADYFEVKTLLDDWNELKRYYATKLKYRQFDHMTMFGVSERDVIDVWLTQGYAIESKFQNLVLTKKHTARH